MQSLQQVLGLSEEQRAKFLELVAETISNNAAADLIEAMSEEDRKSLADAVKKGGDVNAAVAGWAKERYAGDQKSVEILDASVKKSLDAITQELWDGMDNAQRQKLQTMHA
jgi:hypothetical protein